MLKRLFLAAASAACLMLRIVGTGQAAAVSPIQTQTCSSGQFIDALSAAGVLDCATPSVSGGSGVFGPVMSIPTSAGLPFGTWQNQNGASVGDTSLGVTMVIPTGQSGNDYLSLQCGSVAGAGWTIKVLMAVSGFSTNNSNDIQGVLGFYSGGNFEVLRLWHENGAYAVKVTDGTSLSGGGSELEIGSVISTAQSPMWLAVQNDNAGHLNFMVSGDGMNWTVQKQVTAISGFLSAYGTVCWGGGAQQAGVAVTLMSYAKTTP